MSQKTQIGELFQDIVTIKKNCLYISSRENTAVVRHKQLYPVAAFTQEDSNLYFEIKHYESGQKAFYVYIDYGFITYDLHVHFSEYHTPEDIKNRFNGIPSDQFTYAGMKQNIVEMINQSKFIDVAKIKLLSLAGEKETLIQEAITSRANYIKAREEKEQLENNQKLEAAQNKYNVLLEKYNSQLIQAEKTIIEKQKLENEILYKPVIDGRYVHKDDKNLVLELFKKHDIKVPLKTQGWIGDALAQISYNDNGITYSYYSTSKNSTVFLKYLKQLELKIQEAHGFVDPYLQNKVQEEKQKEAATKKIQTLKWKEIDRRSYRQHIEINTFMKQNETIQLEKSQLEEVARIAYKALSAKDIEHCTKNWFILDEILGSGEYKGHYHFGHNGKEIEVYPRLVDGELKILYRKSTNKEYMCIA